MSRISPVDYATASGRQKELLGHGQGGAGRDPEHDDDHGPLGGPRGVAQLQRRAPEGLDSRRRRRADRTRGGRGQRLLVLPLRAQLPRLNVAGLDDGEIARARRFQSADPKSAAILAFAQAIVSNRGSVSDSHVAAAREAGLTDAELSDIVGHVAINVLTNYFNKAFDVGGDFPVVEPQQYAAAA